MGVDRHNLNVPAIFAMYQDGWSLRALSRLLRISATAIKARFDREGMPTERYHRKVSLRRLAELNQQGLSQTQMAERLQVSRTAVFRALERLRAKYPEHAPAKRMSGRWHASPASMIGCIPQGSLAEAALLASALSSEAHQCSSSPLCRHCEVVSRWAVQVPQLSKVGVESVEQHSSSAAEEAAGSDA